jgi:hypothetical protein
MTLTESRSNIIKVAKDTPTVLLSILARLDGNIYSDSELSAQCNLLIHAYNERVIPKFNMTARELLPLRNLPNDLMVDLPVYNLNQGLGTFVSRIDWPKLKKERPVLFTFAPPFIKQFMVNNFKMNKKRAEK